MSFVHFDVHARQSLGFVGKTIEAIGENQQSRCPEAYEDPKTLSMSASLSVITIQEPPDGDGENDGKKPQLEKDGA